MRLTSCTGSRRSESGPVYEHTSIAAAFTARIHNGREPTSAAQDSGIQRSNKTCAQLRVSYPSRATITPPPHRPGFEFHLNHLMQSVSILLRPHRFTSNNLDIPNNPVTDLPFIASGTTHTSRGEFNPAGRFFFAEVWCLVFRFSLKVR